MIRKCIVCAEERSARHEPLIPSEFPERPWQKVGMDLFYDNGKWYMVVCDYYSRYPEVVTLQSLRGDEVVKHLKSIFARHGVPELVYSDNGTQFSPSTSSQFQEFARDYEFAHSTSSPIFPQSNGFAENSVKIVKKILKKNKDPFKALMEYRASPLSNGYSPAELLFGRKIRTVLPCLPSLLEPAAVDGSRIKQWEERRRDQQKGYYDRRHGAREKNLEKGEKVWVRDRREWGVIIEKANAPRSYWVQTENGKYRRNSYDLESVGMMVEEEMDPDFEFDEASQGEPENVMEAQPEAGDDQPLPQRSAAEQSRYGRRYQWTDRYVYGLGV